MDKANLTLVSSAYLVT